MARQLIPDESAHVAHEVDEADRSCRSPVASQIDGGSSHQKHLSAVDTEADQKKDSDCLFESGEHGSVVNQCQNAQTGE